MPMEQSVRAKLKRLKRFWHVQCQSPYIKRQQFAGEVRGDWKQPVI